LIPTGETIWIADAHRDNEKRFVGHADEKLSAFLELERVMRESLRFPNARSFQHHLVSISVTSDQYARAASWTRTISAVNFSFSS
jgi:hypothetical protein